MKFNTLCYLIEGKVLDNLNPTSGIFVDYSPEKIMKMKLGSNMTTLDKTRYATTASGISPILTM